MYGANREEKIYRTKNRGQNLWDEKQGTKPMGRKERDELILGRKDLGHNEWDEVTMGPNEWDEM